MKRRDFLKAGLAAGAAVVAPKVEAQRRVDPFEFDELTVAELRARIDSGRETAATLAEKYIERIEEVDRGGPRVNSVIEINPEAIDIARSLDRSRRARGPLFGMPVLIKDNIETADKMDTTAGSLLLEGNRAKKDAFIVNRLRNAGAVIIGKTNLSEWANFRSTHSTSVLIRPRCRRSTPSALPTDSPTAWNAIG